jgi:Peptidase family M1 domain
MLRRLQPMHVLLAAAALGLGVFAAQDPDRGADRFRQLRQELPTPNNYRTASGAPGHEYWQQRADYEIEVAIEPESRRLTGHERVHYHNNSPDGLNYLWMQVEPNKRAPMSHAVLTSLAPSLVRASLNTLSRQLDTASFDGSCTIENVQLVGGFPLDTHTVDTMMRIELPTTLQPGASVAFELDWAYTVNDTRVSRGRTGAEYLADGNWIYGMAQWFPRLCAYTDYTGWQNKEFLGGGEFTLEFGDYEVAITMPADHVVTASGILINPDEVLSVEQRERLELANESDTPIMIVTREESDAARDAARTSDTKTWRWSAENVRDFAWSSSRAFLWDAMGQPVDGLRMPVLCQSLWPREGDPLWGMYSTHAVAHTLEVYGRMAFPYPYPTAISVNGVVGGGMEYPMICFNGPRPEADGTYSSRTKYGLISVIIHEVGHNWFPMIVNSDERQWTWMDEGLNSFLQFLSEREWEDEYPARGGEPRRIVGYMTSENQVAIMNNAESLLQGGPNAYTKPATALNILRETIIGRENFDFAFKTFSERWMFKRPEPADFFRTMEDASGVDLDWFFRNWFFTTDHVDLGLAGLQLYRLADQGPEAEAGIAKAARDAEPARLTVERNRKLQKRVDRFPELLDFYNRYDALDPTEQDVDRWEQMIAGLNDKQRATLASDLYWYVAEVRNDGGIPMPLVFHLQYEDGTDEVRRIPAEIWRKNNESVSKLLICEKPLARLTLDPYLETADADLSDNHWPPSIEETRIPVTPGSGRPSRPNPMRRAQGSR